jgi:hypothetical protein
MVAVWLASTGFFLAFLFTVIRTELGNPRLGWAPSSPYYERLVYDLMGCAAGLRGWMVFAGHVSPTPSEVALALTLAAVAGLGLVKILGRTVVLRKALALVSAAFGPGAQPEGPSARDQALNK